MKFPRLPVSTRSTAHRKLIFGVGVNDSPYRTKAPVYGIYVDCPLYSQWKAAIQRCYCPKWKERYPSYAHATIVPEWLTYSNFLAWAEAHDWEGKSLDKDLKVSGNKEYGPLTCLWVPADVNKLVVFSKARKGPLPVGVRMQKGRYLAGMSAYGKPVHIGLFNKPEEAADAFNTAKAAHIRNVAAQQDPSLCTALLRIAVSVEAGTYYA